MTVEPLSPHSAAMRTALGCLCMLRKLQREAVLVLREARHGRLPGKACELATQVQLCVVILFDFVSRVLGIGSQAALDRVRPDDSIFLLVSVLGRYFVSLSRACVETIRDSLSERDITVGNLKDD